jgi:hypothetical protein
VHEEIGQLIVAEVNKELVNRYLDKPTMIDEILEINSSPQRLTDVI